MISAITSLLTPSTESLPVAQAIPDAALAQLELMMVLPVALGLVQLLATAYQSGSPATSTSLSVPIVRQGKRPTAGVEQLEAICPSCVGLSKYPGASGH